VYRADKDLINVHRYVDAKEGVPAVLDKVVIISRYGRWLWHQGSTAVKRSIDAVIAPKGCWPTPDVGDLPGITLINISGSFKSAVHADVVRAIEEVADGTAIECPFDAVRTETLRETPVGEWLRISTISFPNVAISIARNADVLRAFEEIREGTAPQRRVDAICAETSRPPPLRDGMRSLKVLLPRIDVSVAGYSYILRPFEEVTLGSAVERCIDTVCTEAGWPLPISDGLGIAGVDAAWAGISASNADIFAALEEVVNL